VNATTKEQALKFLEQLEEKLKGGLPGPTEMEAWIRSTVADVKTDDKKKHLRIPEAAFLNEKALPLVSQLLTDRGLSKAQAQQALLSEYYRMTPDIAQRSPIRWERHPFRKVLGCRASDIYRNWINPEERPALMRSCPDFSLRDPFPHTILFEGKYFPRGSLEFAQRQLVSDIYQVVFYRGLPPLAETKRHPEWNYDYPCLMAYDASPKGTLTSAWKELPLQTRRSFWEGANVYIMVLRPLDARS
jgi:hypothetical protein